MIASNFPYFGDTKIALNTRHMKIALNSFIYIFILCLRKALSS